MVVERLSGPLEAEHGTDLLIRIDNPLGEDSFIIPVQVKKHTGESDDGVDQLEIAAKYWKNEGRYSNQLIGLALITTAIFTESLKSRLDELQRNFSLPCYLITRKELVELFVDAAGKNF